LTELIVIGDFDYKKIGGLEIYETVYELIGKRKQGSRTFLSSMHEFGKKHDTGNWHRIK
jgi:hypothetical protein